MPPSDPAAAQRSSRRMRLVLFGFMLLCTLAYVRVLAAPFVFDDVGSIEKNEHIESLMPLGRALSAPAGSGASGRPLVALSLALNYAIGERNVLGYRLFNLGLHLVTAGLLFAVLRRAQSRAGAGTSNATTVAALITSIWVVHPLHTAALNHVVYRNEMLASAFMLATFFCALRGFAGTRAAWFALATLCGLGAALSKETASALPLIVLLFDRTFVSRTFGGALKRNAPLYLGLALIWPLIAWLTWIGDRGVSVGTGVRDISAFDYLRTQAGVLLHYAHKTFWPSELVLDYDDWSVVRTWSGALLPAAAVCAGLAAALYGVWKRSLAGFAGVSAFLILAPTSSVVPLTGALVGDHRAYLPACALLIALATLACRWARTPNARRIVFGMTVLAGLAAVTRTHARNADFESPTLLWTHNVEVRPANSRAWNNLGHVQFQAGDWNAAAEAYRRALEVRPDYFLARANLAYLHFSRAEFTAARDNYRLALELDELSTEVRAYLGSSLIALGETHEGTWQIEEALRLGLAGRQRTVATLQLAWSLATDPDESVRNGARALELARGIGAKRRQASARALDVTAAALAETGATAEAAEVARRARAAAEQTEPGLAAAIALRLEAYLNGRPWRENARDAARGAKPAEPD